VRAWSATRPNRLRGVLTLFAPTRPAVRSAKLILTLTTRSSHQPARRYKRHPARLARCAYSPTIPLVALLALRFTCLTPSARPYYVPRCSLLLVLAPSTEIDATRGSRVQSATGNRACSIVFFPCPSLSLSRPFCSSHVASREFLSYVGGEKSEDCSSPKFRCIGQDGFARRENVR